MTWNLKVQNEQPQLAYAEIVITRVLNNNSVTATFTLPPLSTIVHLSRWETVGSQVQGYTEIHVGTDTSTPTSVVYHRYDAAVYGWQESVWIPMPAGTHSLWMGSTQATHRATVRIRYIRNASIDMASWRRQS